MNQELLVKTVRDKKEKYVRYLAVLYVGEGDGQINVNQRMVDLGHALPFMADE